MSQGDDLEAINRYIVAQRTNNQKAEELRNDFIRWYSGLSWLEVHVESSTLDVARNKRNVFNEANAVGDAAYLDVKTVEARGLTTEEMQGDVRRELSSGRYDTSKKFTVPEWAWYAAGGAIVVGSVLIFSYGLAGAIPAALLSKIGAHHRREY